MRIDGFIVVRLNTIISATLKLFVFVSQRDLSSLWRSDYATGPVETSGSQPRQTVSWIPKANDIQIHQTEAKQPGLLFCQTLVELCAGSLDEEDVADLK